MTHLCNPTDDPRLIPVHWSNLKRMALSPAHYLASLSAPREQTRPMRVGSLVHALVLGGEYALWDGDRRAKGYAEWERAQTAPLVVTSSEYDDAAPVAEAICNSAVAAPWLKGRHEVPLEWTVAGRRCRTRGIDILGEAHIAELKTTHIAAPAQFRWQALRMGYHAQLSWYAQGWRNHRQQESGAFAVHWDPDLIVIAVETKPPYPVVVYRLSDRAIDEGQRMNALWLERLKVCEDAGEWPGYAQDVVELDVAESVELEFDGD